MVKSPSTIHLSTPVSSPPHSPIATPPSVDISTDFSASRDTSFFDDVDDDINGSRLASPITPEESSCDLHYKFLSASSSDNSISSGGFRRNLLTDLMDCETQVSKMSLKGLRHSPSHLRLHQLVKAAPSPIFEIPEILTLILRYVGCDDEEKIPVEETPNRRPPLSYNHAVMVHGSQSGKQIWSRSVSTSSVVSNKPGVNNKSANLYNCLFVNKLWYSITYEILQENLYFQSDERLAQYEQNVTRPARYPA
ncbi:unnamed protein product [Ambrosiozyma monospora]|uniref:Unnamed protein product n=1 Tax=Ambrosiozyma monospora TaxID=43982 RepID=A0ACB5U6R6_AMBMO|nr:unnamed protein product [Ambrosiozyma monospora]